MPSGPATLVVRLVNFSTGRIDFTATAGEPVTVDVQLALAITADVVVTGSRTFRNIADLDNPRENLVGVASSASVGAVTAAQLEARPIMRPGEVLESVPGFIVSQHSGEGKANQYYLRGFNLDHGSDFATTLAGVPLNESSGAHAHGYTDVNQLIPELVSGVQYTKGPYFAEHGDFSAAGSANISYVNRLDRPLFSLSTGGQGWGRALGAVSPQVAGGDLLMALELGRNDGPWELKDNMRKANGVLRYSRGDLPERLLADRHGLRRRLERDRPDSAARGRAGADHPVRQHRPHRRRPRLPLLADVRRPAVPREPVDAGDRLRAARRAEPVPELHLLPREPGGRRPGRAGGGSAGARGPGWSTGAWAGS